MAGDLTLTLRIAADGRDAANGLRVVSSEIRSAGAAAGAGAAPVRTLSDSFGTLGSAALKLAGTLGLGLGTAELVQGFIGACLEAQKLEKGLTAVTGSSILAAQEMDYIKQTASKMGASLGDVSGAYLNLAASAKGTALEGQATRDIFEAITLSMEKLGKSSADTEGALLAISQMMTKGEVKAEELTGQLGERLPGALQAAATAMGKTTAEILQMAENGELLASDLLPALSEQLKKMYDDGKQATGLTAEWNLLRNAMANLAVVTEQATGSTEKLGGMMSWATGLANQWAEAIIVVKNAQAGLGFVYGERDDLAALFAKRKKLLDDYLTAVNRANMMGGGELSLNVTGATEGLQKLAETERAIQAIRGELKKTEEANDELAEAQAISMGDGAVQLWEQHTSAIKKDKESVDKLVASYDPLAKKEQQITKAREDLNAAVASGAKTRAEADAILKAYTASLDKETGAKGKAAGTSKALSEAQKEEKKTAEDAKRAHDENIRSVEGLIDRYLPAVAAAQDYEDAMAALAEAGNDVKLAQDQAGLSADQLRVIQQGLQADLQKTQIEAVKSAGGVAGAWVQAAEEVDDAFASLWRSLITGEGNILGDLKKTVLDWVSDLSYELLLKPLILPIQGVMMGMAGLPTGASMNGQGGTGSGFSLSGIGNWFGGSSMGTGIANGLYGFGIGQQAAYGGMGPAAMSPWLSNIASVPNWALSGGGMVGGIAGSLIFPNGYGPIGSSVGSMAGSIIGAAFGPVGAFIGGLLGGVGGGGIGSLFGAEEPRYGTIVAQTNGSLQGLEDSWKGDQVSSRGGFGLAFGLDKKGTQNADVTEFKPAFDALADTTKKLEEFFGEDLSRTVEEELKKLSNFGDGLIHLTEDEGDLGAAMAALIGKIGQAAGKSSDEIGIAFSRLSGDLGGSADEVAQQLQTVIAATLIAAEASDKYYTSVGQMLGLTGSIGTDMDRLVGLSKLIQDEGEITAQAVIRLVQQMGLLSDAAFTTGQDLTKIDPKKLTVAADELVKLMGGVDAAGKAISFYTANFMSAGEIALKSADALFQDLAQGWKDLEKDWGGIGEVFDPGPLPKTREEFTRLVTGLDLTTERGRELYNELMKLAPGFDAVFDAIESFEAWIDPAGELDRAAARVEATFKSLGLEMPRTYEALQELYKSGKLTATQILVLTAILPDLDLVLKQTGDSASTLTADMWGLSGSFSATMESITNSIDNAKKGIEDWGLTNEQLYDKYMGQADQWERMIATATDPAEIEKYAKLAADARAKAWDLLSDEEKNQAKGQFIGYLDDLEKTSADRIKIIQDANAGADKTWADAVSGFGDSASIFETSVGNFGDSVSALANVIGSLTQVNAQQAAYATAMQSQPAFIAVAPDTSFYQGMASALTAAAEQLRASAAEYQKAGTTMDSAAKGMTTAGAKIATAASNIPSSIDISVTATNATATVEATF